MEHVEVGGLRIVYERAGDGPPLVLVHGFGGDGISTWSHQLEGLSDVFTVVAWDAPGAGRSSEPPDWFRLPDYAECLAGFVRALGLERAHACVRSVPRDSGPWPMHRPKPTRATSSRRSRCRHCSSPVTRTSELP